MTKESTNTRIDGGANGSKRIPTPWRAKSLENRGSVYNAMTPSYRGKYVARTAQQQRRLCPRHRARSAQLGVSGKGIVAHHRIAQISQLFVFRVVFGLAGFRHGPTLGPGRCGRGEFDLQPNPRAVTYRIDLLSQIRVKFVPDDQSLAPGGVVGKPAAGRCATVSVSVVLEAALGRTRRGHQNQRPSTVAAAGIMNERTIRVSNNNPIMIVVPIWPTTRGSLVTMVPIVNANTSPAVVTTRPVLPMDRIARATTHAAWVQPGAVIPDRYPASCC